MSWIISCHDGGRGIDRCGASQGQWQHHESLDPPHVTLPFDVAFVEPHAFGVIAGVSLPPGKDPVDDDVLARLHPLESAVARSLRGYRQIEWAGARLAWHAAAERLGIARAALLSGHEREPLSPEGVSVSITHKRDLAIALVADAAHGSVGIDLESVTGAASNVASKILRPEELRAIHDLTEPALTAAILLRFAVKEATYKAIYPLVRRHVAYDEARVEVDASGHVDVTLLLRGGALLPHLDATCEWRGARVIAAVRCPRG